MAYGVPVVLDKWQGKQDLLVVMLDDFDVILGLDFLKKAKIALMLIWIGFCLRMRYVLVLFLVIRQWWLKVERRGVSWFQPLRSARP